MSTPLKNEDDALVFLPLGGAGEIGMNLNLYGLGPANNREWIMVDLGVTFGDDSTPGIDLIMPDTAFIEEEAAAGRLKALFLTHAHEDHIGAVPHLWQHLGCPVYATPFTAYLLRDKLQDVGLLHDVPLHEVPLGGSVTVGGFEIDYVTLTHSIPEPNALSIKTRFGTVMHTGDWKIDPDPLIGEKTDSDTLSRIGDEGVLAIVCDSTNVFVEGRAGSEKSVRENLEEMIRPMKGRVAVTTFASNVSRVQTVAKVAAACGRHPVLVGRSMHRCVAAARACGYLEGMPPIIDEEEGAYLPKDKVLFICTGSQGEPRAALSRIARNDHRTISLDADDTVIFSSRVIPGNETSIFNLQNDLTAIGVNVLQDKNDTIHVSGHPCRDELAQMYQWIRPEIAVPVHGEHRHLKEHAAFARDMQVKQTHVNLNGGMVQLAPGPSGVVDHVPSGRLMLDGDILIDSDDEVLKQRRRLAFNGYIHVVALAQGKKLSQLRVSFEGLADEDWDGRPLEDMITQACRAAWSKAYGRKGRPTEASLAEVLRIAARRTVKDGIGKRAMVKTDVICL